MTHIMENIIYNELIIRGCAVDIGIVYSNEKDSKRAFRTDCKRDRFCCNTWREEKHISICFCVTRREKAETENKPFLLTGDSFSLKSLCGMIYANVGMMTMAF